YPFAHCFVCNEQGHLASKCPQNDRGVYPNGGCCRFCGSIRHLSKDCKPANAAQGKVWTCQWREHIHSYRHACDGHRWRIRARHD
ncbi:hypothetical protein SYNPS1DRAFT_19465, partial [Syncephalis pseudoplumigaleata]